MLRLTNKMQKTSLKKKKARKILKKLKQHQIQSLRVEMSSSVLNLK